MKTIDLGAGYANGNESLIGRAISALKQNGLLSKSVGVGYIERNWPPAFKDTGAWPLRGLRQNFLDGSLTRLLDPDSVLKQRLVEFVENGRIRARFRAGRPRGFLQDMVPGEAVCGRRDLIGIVWRTVFPHPEIQLVLFLLATIC